MNEQRLEGRSGFSRIRFGALAFASLAMVVTPLQAALTDISSTPITSSSSAQVKPNIMLLMDTSGSMSWGHTPDEVESLSFLPAGDDNREFGYTKVGYKAFQCNLQYYNPLTTYVIPNDANRNPLTTSFNSARFDPFDTTNLATVNLATDFQAYTTFSSGGSPANLVYRNTLRTDGRSDLAQPAYYYVYSGPSPISGHADPRCLDADPYDRYDNAINRFPVPTPPATTVSFATAAPVGGTWTRVRVSSVSGPGATDERLNFAIWYTFYRTRMAMIKSAASLAFTPLTDSFRVGFITVNPKFRDGEAPSATNPDLSPGAAVQASKYLAIKDFDSSQRSDWFSKLFSQKAGGSSPAREGLSRVGRHYAGKTDGINTGMPEDPVQYSCQQNFTIMTTDGYWNAQSESTGIGPVMVDGVTKVGQQDGTLTGPAGNTPRPIWDGVPDGKRTVVNRLNSYAYAPCGTYFWKTDTQVSRVTSQIQRTTSQLTRSTYQSLQSTSQILRSQTQTLQSTSQPTQSTLQNLQSTRQALASTTQNLSSTTQRTERTVQHRRSTVQNLQSTVQNLQTSTTTVSLRTWVDQFVRINRESTTQRLQSTSQMVRNTSQPQIRTQQNLQRSQQPRRATNQNLRSTNQTRIATRQQQRTTVQNLRSTSQTLRSSTQTLQSTTQALQSTHQVLQSTSQITISTVQARRNTSQWRSCSASSETCTAVPTAGACTPSADITCEEIKTGPTLVASCVPETANLGNNYTNITCAFTNTGPTPAASCTNTPAGPGNAYTQTICNSTVTTNVPVASCNPAAASGANAYTSTTCTPVDTGPVAVASCSPIAAGAGNNWTATTCSNNNTAPVGVSACTPVAASSGNGWTAVVCTPNNTTNVPVASCSAQTGDAGNGWLTVTCTPNNTTNVPVASCSPITAAAGNNWTTTSCSNNNSANVPVASCSTQTGNAGNSYVTITCPVANTGPTPTSTCTPVLASSGNNWTETTCPNLITTDVPVATCTPAAASSGNSWTTTTCPTPITTGPTPVASCSTQAATSANSWVSATCPNYDSGSVPVLTCTPQTGNAGNSFMTITCPAPVVTGPSPSGTCSPIAASSGNNWTETTCPVAIVNNQPWATCSPQTGDSGNAWLTISCPGPITTGPTPVATCNPAGANSGNNWTTRTCSNNNTTNVPVASCTPAAANAGNNFTARTCPAPIAVSGPTRVQTCTPVAGSSGNGFQETYCVNGSSSVPSGTCVPEAASAGNNWVTTTCDAVITGPVPVLSCTPQTGNAGNGWTTITCPAPNVTTNVPVASCTPSAATSLNTWVATSCPPPVTTTNVPVASCAPSAASAGNSFVTTTCNDLTTGPTGVASCTDIAADLGNSWTATICGWNNTVNQPVASCIDEVANAGNGWTARTCSVNNQPNVPVASCTPIAPSSGNGWTTTTCPPAIVTTDVPVLTCVDQPEASGNNWTRTTCSVATTGPTVVSTCTAIAPDAGNAWTRTTCGNNGVGTPVGVQTCTPQTGDAGNNWLTVTCTSNNTINVPVDPATCSTQVAAAGNAWMGVTCTPATTTSVPVASCTPSPATLGNNWIATTCVSNNVLNVPDGACTPIAAGPLNNWTATTCPVVTTGPTGVETCSAATANAGNSWTATSCNTVNSAPVPVASCTAIPATAGNGWLATACPTVITGPTLVTTCTAAAANLSNAWTGTTCTPAGGTKLQYVTTTTTDVTYYSGGTPSSSEPTVTVTSPPADVDGVCYAPNVTAPALPTPNPQPPAWTSDDTTAYPSCSSWPCTMTEALGGARSINSLADVAQYYYITDLRPATDWPANIATNDVPSVGSGPEDDRVRWQHMTTFTVGLGVSGTLQYRPDYKRGTTTTGDFADIRTGVKSWPLWPDPGLNYTGNPNLWNDPRSIDDFWHAAVNGRGTYFSAGNPQSVIAGLQEALAGIAARLASASGAGVSNLEPVAGDNLIYLGNYTTQKWTGDVQAKEIDLSSGSILPAVVWSAQSLLDARVKASCDDRKIKLFRNGATDNLTNFSWNTYTCDGSGNPSGAPDTGLNATEQAMFNASKTVLLSQYVTDWTDGSSGTVDQRSLAPGANLVNFLRGQNGRAVSEVTPNTTDAIYRLREHALGDIVNGAPTYVRKPFASYGDPDYAAYKLAQASRIPMLYVPANDGMLHAFYAGTSKTDPDGGKEAWAFVPSSVLPNLYLLADKNYKNNHRYFVDGTPTVTDAYIGGTWKTVLVAGLNNGGKGYYALDVTDPLNPKGLWEFKWDSAVCPSTPSAAAGNTSDCHLGYTYGRPVVSKLADGTWVAMVTSGYNNVNAPAQAGDGEGYLYVLNAETGAIRYKIPTGVGDASTPSGLAQISSFIQQAETNNETVRVYGTDLLGNIWRFDVNDKIAPAGREATLVGQAKDQGGNPQPITTRAELSEHKGDGMVFVATGRLLGASDVDDLQTQSIYGFVDPLTGSPSYANLRGALAPLRLTQVGSGAGTYRTVSCVGTAAQCGSDKGWVINLADSGERVNVEMKLQAGTLVVGSNIPQISACTSGGYSWLNQFYYQSGLAVPDDLYGGFGGNDNNAVSELISNSLIVGLTVIKLPGLNTPPFTIFATGSNAEITKHDGRMQQPGGSGKRITWREVLAN